MVMATDELLKCCLSRADGFVKHWISHRMYILGGGHTRCGGDGLHPQGREGEPRPLYNVEFDKFPDQKDPGKQ